MPPLKITILIEGKKLNYNGAYLSTSCDVSILYIYIYIHSKYTKVLHCSTVVYMSDLCAAFGSDDPIY